MKPTNGKKERNEELRLCREAKATLDLVSVIGWVVFSTEA